MITLQRLIDYPALLNRMNNGTLKQIGVNHFYTDAKRGKILVEKSAYNYAMEELKKLNQKENEQ
jgi:hypothetical protein